MLTATSNCCGACAISAITVRRHRDWFDSISLFLFQDTLRTHVAGVLTRHPEWESDLAGFQIESAWMVGAWDDVQQLTQKIKIETSPMVTGRVLLAMRTGIQKPCLTRYPMLGRSWERQ